MKVFLQTNGTLVFLAVIISLGSFYYWTLGENRSENTQIIVPNRVSEKITMFSKKTCIYCVRAKNYLKQKGLVFHEVDLAGNRAAYEELSKLMTRVTVPQIFIGDHHVGGYSDLIKLSEEELTTLLYPEGN